MIQEINLEKVSQEVGCWLGDVSAAKLGEYCVKIAYYPWESKNLPLFLRTYLRQLRNQKCHIAESISRYLWNLCPYEYKDNYVFLYDIGYLEYETTAYQARCSWPNINKIIKFSNQIQAMVYYETKQLESFG